MRAIAVHSEYVRSKLFILQNKFRVGAEWNVPNTLNENQFLMRMCKNRHSIDKKNVEEQEHKERLSPTTNNE